jgi:CRISPR-associated protein Csd1
MSWMQKLYETYEACSAMRGQFGEGGKRPLLPICHITRQAHIEVTLDNQGNLNRAKLITDARDATTIIPATEASAGKTSGLAPHPLCDELQYVAGDLINYSGADGRDEEQCHRKYVQLLNDWCSPKFAHLKVKAVLEYVKKRTLIKDLVEHGILSVGNNGKLLSKRASKKIKGQRDILDVTKNKQDKAFVRWRVVGIPGDREPSLSKDKNIWDSWINYYLNAKQKKSLCYVTGKNALVAKQHPKFLRRKGDGAKLISSNDERGFTFRGRFLTALQACGVSLEASHKAHNALIWLIDRQGKVFTVKGDRGRAPGLTVLAWAPSDKKIVQPTQSSYEIFPELASDEPIAVDTAQDLALKLQKKILGYKADIGSTPGVQVMAMDSASKGRLAVTYYRELEGSDYLERIEEWHRECTWLQYEYNNDTKKWFTFVGAPSPKAIAEAAYVRADDRLKQATIERLLPCIVDREPLPRDIMDSAVRRASNRVAFLKHREWEKTLSIACALFKKFMYDKHKENYSMALNPNITARDYLYGRLLAIADHLEGHALHEAGDKGSTNAARYMQRFADRPFSTWTQIELSLVPYQTKLGGAHYYTSLIDEVMRLFDPSQFQLDTPLTGMFLLGYHCQSAKIWDDIRKKGKDKKQQENQQNQNNK